MPSLIDSLKKRYSYKVNVEKSIVSMHYLNELEELKKYQNAITKNDAMIEDIYIKLNSIVNSV